MVLAGLGTGGEAAANAQGLSGFSLIRSASLTLQRNATSQNGGGEVPAEFSGTTYGQQYWWLARKNKPAVAVARAPISYVGPYPYLYGGFPTGEW
jgi:hypothetical protein